MDNPIVDWQRARGAGTAHGRTVALWALRELLQAPPHGLRGARAGRDGELNHLHLQLFPRYPGKRIGATRFVVPRDPLVDGEGIAERITMALAHAGE